MGDIVISYRGQELRLTHADFERLGQRDGLFGLKIPLSKRWETITGTRQIALYHTDQTQTEKEEERIGGHNARYSDVYGVMGMFASTREQRSSIHDMHLPNDVILRIEHEWGEHGSIEGQALVVPEQLNDGVKMQESSGNFFDRFLGRRR